MTTTFIPFQQPPQKPTPPRVCLIYPDGSTEWYERCAIEDSLLPDLIFRGDSVNRGRRERVVTNLAYKIVTVVSEGGDEENGLLEICKGKKAA